MARKKLQHTPSVPLPVAGEVDELLFGADGEDGVLEEWHTSADGSEGKRKITRRQAIKGIAAATAGLAAAPLVLGSEGGAAAAPPASGSSSSPPLAPSPGAPRPWMASIPVYSGACNLSTGNAQLVQPVCGWGGKGGGLQFSLYFNSQSRRTSALGPKWSHSFLWYIVGSNPAVVVAGDGTETTYSLNSGQYVPPAGVYDTLVHNADGTWTLTVKGGTQYRFRQDGLLNSIVDLNGNTISLAYSGTLVTQVADAAGRTLQLGYSSGRLTSVTDAEGRTWTISYDGANRVVSLTTPPLNGQTFSTRFAYDSSNNVTAITNRLGRTWKYSYGSNGVLASTTDPSGATQQVGYAPVAPILSASRTATTSTATAVSVVAESTVTDPTGAATQYGLDGYGRPVTITDPAGNRTQQSFDAAHNLIGRALPSGALWTYSYDGRGNRLSETDPLNNTVQMTYAGDLLTSIRDPLGNVTQYAYDARGNQTQITDPAGNITQKVYYADGSLAQVTDPAGKVTTFQYDTNGNLVSTTDPLGNVTQQVWANTLLAQRTDARNRTTTYTYDAWGRLVGITYPAGGSAPVSLSYDAEGRLVQSVDGTGTRTYSYDDWGRRTAVVCPAGTASASYDAAGRLLTQTDVSGRTVQYNYDVASRLTQVGDTAGAASYGWTVDGNVAVETYPNGTRKEVSYDAAGRVVQITHRVVATGAVIVGYSAQYDAAGRLTQVTEQPSGDVTTYQYDAAGRLVAENRTGQRAYSSQYTYDSRGNRVTAFRSEGGVVSHNATYTYDDAGRLTQVVDAANNTTEVFTWYPDGTVASYPGPGYTRLCEYDEEQRLIRIRRDYGGGNVQVAYEYGYGYDGFRRWRKDYTANLWTRYPCTAASCAGDLVEQQGDLSGGNWVVSATYLKGVGLVRRNNEFHHFDVLGTAGVITGASGAVLSANVYDAFGVARYVSGNAQTRWRWLQAEEEGLVHISKEDYLPQWGVVLQQQRGDLDEDLCEKRYQICRDEAKAAYDAAIAVWLAVCASGTVISLASKCFGLCKSYIVNPGAFLFCQGACMAMIAGGCAFAKWWIERELRVRNQKCLDDYEKCMRNARKKKKAI